MSPPYGSQQQQQRRWRLPLIVALLVVIAIAYLARPADPTRAGEGRTSLADPANWATRLWRDATGAQRLTESTDDTAQLRLDNARLRAELATVRQELDRWRRGLEQGRAGETIDFPPGFVFVAADVVGASPEPSRHSIRINRGTRHGIRPDMPVTTDVGLVGIVRRASDSEAIVQLLTDPFYVVAARAARGRWAAIARGRGAGEGLQVEPLAAFTLPPEGELLVTSGGDSSLYPAGLPIGIMRPAGSDKYGMDLILCEPLIFDEPLEFVLVLTNRR
jgi:rod shape-determining protein MreC